MNQLHVLDLPADRMDGEVVAAFFFADERPVRGPAALLDWRLNGLLTNLLVQGRASGRAGEHILVRSNGKLAANWVLFMGGGSWHGLGRETYQGLVRHLLLTCRKAGISRIALCLAPPAAMKPAGLEQMVAEVLAGMGEQGPECRLSLAA